jgi:hypothetical protein
MLSSFFSHTLAVLLGVLAVVSNARDAPKNLLDFYDAIRAKGHCSHELATGFYSRNSGSNGAHNHPSPLTNP